MLLIPTNLDVSVRIQRAYVAYCWLVSLSAYGKVPKEALKPFRARARYWTRKLEQAGWIVDRGDHFALTSSRKIWGILGVKRVSKYGRRAGIIGYRYTRLDFSYQSDKDFFVKGFRTLQQYLADRKKSQIVSRLASTGGASKRLIAKFQKPRFGCEAVANTLGYKSPSSGYRHRKDYFVLASPPHPKPIVYLNMHGCQSFRYPCATIHLDR